MMLLLKYKNFFNKLLIKTPNIRIILRKLQVKEKFIMITAILVIFFWSKIDIVYAMEHGKTALDIAKSVSENNIQEAERLLRTASLTETQIRDLNEIINKSLQTHQVDQLAVNNLELQNSGVPHQESINTRNILIGLGIAAVCTVSLYLIFRHWNNIRDFFFDLGRHAPSATRQILLQNFELVRHNPQVINELNTYLNTVIIEIVESSE